MFVRTLLKHSAQIAKTANASAKHSATSVARSAAAQIMRGPSARFFSTNAGHNHTMPATTVRVIAKIEEMIIISRSRIPTLREVIHFSSVDPRYTPRPGEPNPISVSAVLHHTGMNESKTPEIKVQHLEKEYDLGMIQRYFAGQVKHCSKSLEFFDCPAQIELLAQFSKEVEKSENIVSLLSLITPEVQAALEKGGLRVTGHDYSLYDINDRARRDAENHSPARRSNISL